MSRRQAREAAMQALFCLDINEDGQDAINFAWGEGGGEEDKRGEDSLEYARFLFAGACENLAGIDGILSGVSHKWRLSRMSGVDRSILRLSVYELRFVPGMEPGVVINEAVELAKKFGTDKSPRFINGILGDMVKNKPG